MTQVPRRGANLRGIMPLNPRQQKFVTLYLATGNATQSYIDAGYTKDPEAARRNASRMLTNADVAAAIESANAKAVQTAELTAEWWVKGLKEEATYYGDGAQHSARIKAYELLGKRLFPDAVPPAPAQGGLSFESIARILAALGNPPPVAGGPGGGAGGTDDPLI
jgi:phage terminase small subunit